MYSWRFGRVTVFPSGSGHSQNRLSLAWLSRCYFWYRNLFCRTFSARYFTCSHPGACARSARTAPGYLMPRLRRSVANRLRCVIDVSEVVANEARLTSFSAEGAGERVARGGASGASTSPWLLGKRDEALKERQTSCVRSMPIIVFGRLPRSLRGDRGPWLWHTSPGDGSRPTPLSPYHQPSSGTFRVVPPCLRRCE